MYKTAGRLALLLFVTLIGCSFANAQVEITLGTTVGSPNIVTFTNTDPGGVSLLGHRLDLTLGPCTGGGGTICTITSGPNSFLSVGGVPSGASAAYTFTTTLAAAGQLPFLNNPVSGVFAYNANGSTTQFAISGIGVAPGALTLAILIQSVTDGTGTPRFNGTYTVNAVTGGSTLANYFGVGDTNRFNFTVNLEDTGQTLSSLFGGIEGDSSSGPITNGSIRTPEPASIALFGSGLILLGRVLRRRSRQAPSDLGE